jgi:hypothetical protein
MVEKVKTIAKYVVNILAIVNALLVGILPVWGIDGNQITDTIAVVIAVLSTYLLGNKVVAKKGDK